MKFNLKNRPKLEIMNYPHKMIEDWFEGFEKELRELIGNLENLKIKDNPECPQIIILHINEILGEKES